MKTMTKAEWRRAMAAEITVAREAADLSKRALARILGVPPTYVVQWEQGKGIGEDSVCRIEAALGLSAGELFRRTAIAVRPLVGATRKPNHHLGWFGYPPSGQHGLPLSGAVHPPMMVAA